MSPEQLERNFKLPKDSPERQSDIDILHDMLIYHGQFPTNPLLKIHSESWAQKALSMGMTGEFRAERTLRGDQYGRGEGHFYGCRHVKLNGDCGIYETRPEMCRRYPNGDLCEFEDCTMPLKTQVELAEKYDRPWFFSPTEMLRKIRSRGLIPPHSLLQKSRKELKRAEKQHMLKVPDDAGHIHPRVVPLTTLEEAEVDAE
jgi:Fe-S-cluster containining protein